MIETLYFVAVSYLTGSIPFGYLVCRLFRGIDIRTHGSGNIGATNVYRTVGPRFGLPVLFLDMAKGAIPVILAKNFLDHRPESLVIIGVAAVAGHSFPVFLRGKGGKGVATSFGVIAALLPLPAVFSLATWLIVFIMSGYVSAASLIAAFSLPFFILLFGKDTVYLLTGILIFILIVVTHRENIRRMMRKEENRVKLPWTKKPR